MLHSAHLLPCLILTLIFCCSTFTRAVGLFFKRIAALLTNTHCSLHTREFGQCIQSMVKVTVKQGQAGWSEQTLSCSLFILPWATFRRRRKQAAVCVQYVCVCNYICVCSHTVTACFLLLQRRFYPLLHSQQAGVKERLRRRKRNEDEMCDFIVWTLPCKDPSRFCWCFNNLWITMLLLSVSFLPTVLCVYKPMAKTHKYKSEINGKLNALDLSSRFVLTSQTSS